jgi:hypothetical protein
LLGRDYWGFVAGSYGGTIGVESVGLRRWTGDDACRSIIYLFIQVQTCAADEEQVALRLAWRVGAMNRPKL